ncbi:HTH domain-containing protein [Halomicrobium katesii]|nr:HTH domain-containing protein [Halomicrobium katesii]
MTDQSHDRQLRAELYLRGDTYGTYDAQRDVLQRVRELETENVIDESTVADEWQRIRTLNEDRRDGALASYDEFAAWAQRNDYALEPAFERRARSYVGLIRIIVAIYRRSSTPWRRSPVSNYNKPYQSGRRRRRLPGRLAGDLRARPAPGGLSVLGRRAKLPRPGLPGRVRTRRRAVAHAVRHGDRRPHRAAARTGTGRLIYRSH